MKKNMMVTWAVSAVLSAVIAIPSTGKAGESGTTLFSDDFESYPIDTFPSAGGWILVWNGKGTQHQVVSDAYSFTGEKSLQLWGRPSWSSVAQRKFSTDAPVIGYECAIRIDSIGTGGPGREESVSFFNRDVYVWGRGYAAVLFNHDDGEIKAEDGTVLGDWEPGVWYQVKVVLDRSTNTYSTWIDGQLKGQGLSTISADTHNINALALMSDHAGVKVYYDDVRVFTHVGDYGDTAQWNVDFQGDEHHNNTYGQTDPVDYTEWGVYWNIFEVPALSAPWPGPTNYTTNPSMNLVDSEGNSGLVTFSIIGDAYGWAGDAGDDPLTGDYLIILNGFGVTNDPTNWEITGLAPGTTYRLTYYHRANFVDRGVNFVANGIETTISVPGSSVASVLVTTDFLGRIRGTADSNGYNEGNWSALTITSVVTTASNPHPADGATDVPTDVVLGWDPGYKATSHDVYFGTSSPPVLIGNQTTNDYNPGTLEPGATYYWQVNEIEADGTTIHTGDVWEFTTMTGPVKATNPSPADGATDVPTDVVLSWDPGYKATSHDVYFGTSSPPVLIGNQIASEYNPGTLEPGTTYYWKIDEVRQMGEFSIVTTGDLWRFTISPTSESVSNLTFNQLNFLDQEGFVVAADSDWGQLSFDIEPPQDGTVRYLNVSGEIDGATGWIVRNYPVLPEEFIDPGRFALHFDFKELGTSSGTDVTSLQYVVEITETIQPSGPSGRMITAPIHELDISRFGSYIPGADNVYDGPSTLSPPYLSSEVDLEQIRKYKGIPSCQEDDSECAPGSTARSLKWLSNKHKLGLGAVEDIKDDLAKEKYMDQGVTDEEQLKAKKKYIEDKKLPLEVHYWYSKTIYPKGMNTPGIPSESSTDIDLIDWLWRETAKGQDVEITISWASGGGHSVTLVGIDKKNKKLEYRDDEAQGDDTKGDKAIKETDLVPLGNGEYGFDSKDDRIKTAMAESPKPKTACNPSPAHCSTIVDVDLISLCWTPGLYAALHDVYFGTDSDAVDNADTSDTTGIYRGRQDSNSYTPPETLEPDITYYWRVDGVNNLHPDSPWRGNLWSFTRGSDKEEPEKPKWTGLTVYYGIKTELYTSDPCEESPPGTGDKKWKKLDANSVINFQIFDKEFIYFAFQNDYDKDRKKYFQLILKGDGIKKLNWKETKAFKDGSDNRPLSRKKKQVHNIETTVPKKGKDGILYKRMRYRFGPPQPAWERIKFQAKAVVDANGNYDCVIDANSITVRAWSICCRSKAERGDWPDWPEVKSFGIGGPGAESKVLGVTNIENYAFSIWDASFLSQSPGAVIGVPRITDIYVFPDSSTVNTLVPPNLSADPSTGNWTASFVYTDPNGDSRPQGGVRFASDGPGLGTSDRFNLQVFLAGRIDSTYELYAYDQDSGQYMDFGIDADIPECNDVVDDMESYTDDLGDRIFETWRDGRGYFVPPMTYYLGNGTGSSVDINSVTVYEGAQSMRFGYDNTGTGTNIFTDPITVYYSETERTFDTPQDWTKDGVKALSLWFIGDPANDPERMYVAVADSTGPPAQVYHDDPDAAQKDAWTEWNIDLREFSDVGLDLANIGKMYIGIGDRNASEPGGTGTLYFDDISLCPTRCVPEYGPLADFTGDCVVDFSDLEVMGQKWLSTDFFIDLDLNWDGVVNFEDYVYLADTWLDEELWPDGATMGVGFAFDGEDTVGPAKILYLYDNYNEDVLEPDDIILEYRGIPVSSGASLLSTILSLDDVSIGGTVAMKISRGGKIMDVAPVTHRVRWSSEKQWEEKCWFAKCVQTKLGSNRYKCECVSDEETDWCKLGKHFRRDKSGKIVEIGTMCEDANGHGCAEAASASGK